MSEVEAFESKGFVVIEGFFSASTISMVRAGLSEIIDTRAPTPRMLHTHSATAPTRDMTELMWQHRNVLRGEGALPPYVLGEMMSLGARVTGSRLLPFQDVSLVKRAGARRFHWHQDISFWPIDREDGCIVWVALDDCTEENGALMLAPGSHKEGIGPSIDLHTGTAQPGTSAPRLGVDGYEVLELRAGDAVVFDARTLHSSGENRTSSARWALAASFVHVLARWSHDRAPLHPLCKKTEHGREVKSWSELNYPNVTG